jgi:hypothetical protein
MEEYGKWYYIALLIVIILGILNVILFFKIWGMTNDVRILRKKYIPHTSLYFEIRRLLLFGNRERVRDLLINRFIDKIEYLYHDETDCDAARENIDNDFNAAKEELELCFQKIGEELPENIKNLNSCDEFRNSF